MTSSDWINLGQALGTWVIGGAGFYFISEQNKILNRQNEVMRNQAELNQLLIGREAIERDKEDTADTLEKIHLGGYTETQIDEQIDRLLAKGLTFPQLRKRSSAIATLGGELMPIFNRMDAIQERERRRAAVRSLKKQSEPVS